MTWFLFWGLGGNFYLKLLTLKSPGPSGNVHDPKTNYVWPWTHHITSTKYKKSAKSFSRNAILGKSRNLKSPWDWFNLFLKIRNMGSISFKKHEMAILNCSNSIQGIPATQFRFPPLHQPPPPFGGHELSGPVSIAIAGLSSAKEDNQIFWMNESS